MDSHYLVVGMDHVEDNDGAAQRDVEVSVGQQTSNNKWDWLQSSILFELYANLL